MAEFPFESKLRAQVKNRLGRFEVQQSARDDLRDAAVALVLAERAETGETCALMTLRPRVLNRHSGQYALPGGRLDGGETVTEAALRELREELGLALGEDDILGRLDDFPTRSGFRVTPLVMWAEGALELRPDPGEVAEVFWLPLSELNSPDIPRLQREEHGDHPVLSAYFPTLGHYMYAPTAAILYQFREVALRGVATRAAHYEQPGFAWK